jgi:hypothetical protein
MLEELLRRALGQAAPFRLVTDNYRSPISTRAMRLKRPLRMQFSHTSVATLFARGFDTKATVLELDRHLSSR